MSQPRKDLKNTKAVAKEYIKWLKSFDFIEEVYLAGSRARGTETKDSDWDITVLSSRKAVFPDPRLQFKFHCDLKIITDRKFIRDFYIKQ